MLRLFARGLRGLGWRGLALRGLLVLLVSGSCITGYMVGASEQYAPDRHRWISIDAAWRGSLPRREPALAAAVAPGNLPPLLANDESRVVLHEQIGRLRAELIRLGSVYDEMVVLAGLDSEEFGPVETPLLEDWEEEPEKSIELLDRSVAHMSSQTAQLARIIGEQTADRGARMDGLPVQRASVSSGFGMRLHPVHGTTRMHKGIDYRGRTGDPVFAVADGIVTYSGRNGSYGNLVELEHGDGYLTRYAHNEANTVEVGERVSKGDIVAHIGATGAATGPHLHFEIRNRDGAVNPLVFAR